MSDHSQTEMSHYHKTTNCKVKISGANRILWANIPIGTTDNNNDETKTVQLIGRSWAADCTAFVVPSLGIALDAGYPVYGKRMDSVFITHAHTDHIHHLTHLKSRIKPPHFYLPNESVNNVERFLDIAQQMTSNLTEEEYNSFDWKPSYHIHGVAAGERIIVNAKRNLYCHVVQCDHTIPCVGYIFSQIKSTLKLEYKHVPGPEIGILRKKGIQVTEENENYLFCFLGDTTTSILEDDSPYAKKILSCPTVTIECTFLENCCIENAIRTKHVAWEMLKPYIISNPSTTFILTHFSRRWSTSNIRQFFQNDDNIPSNVIPWIPTDDVLYCQNININNIAKDNDNEAQEIEEIYSHS